MYFYSILFPCANNYEDLSLQIQKKHLRGGFLKNRVFLAKSAQNLVTKPAGENPLTAIIFSNKFSKICENLKNFTGSLAT